jgi:hypothetical protein
VARIRETARMVGAVVTFARGTDEVTRAVAADAPSLAIVDLTMADWDYGGLFDALASAPVPPPVLGFTTHALARQTQPLHARCTRVVTKETLTRELGTILKEGIAA